LEIEIAGCLPGSPPAWTGSGLSVDLPPKRLFSTLAMVRVAGFRDVVRGVWGM
jgi:hypothetical protein